MRILVVDVNTEYKNTMYRLFYNSLALVAKIQFYGPGYVSRERLEEGLGAYLKKEKEFDAVIVGVNFIYSTISSGHELDSNCFEIHRYTLPYYSVFDAAQFCKGIFHELISLKHKCKIIFYYSDAYTLPLKDFKLLEELIQKDFYVMSWPFEILQEYSRQIMSKYKKITNYSYLFADKYRSRYLPVLTTAVQPNEFFFGDLSNRKYDFNVPGNLAMDRYPERQKLKENLEKENGRLWDYSPYAELTPLTISRKHMKWYEFHNLPDKVAGFSMGRNPVVYARPKAEYIAANREVYLEALRNTRCSFASGGNANFLVRKYLEICANGGVLVGAAVAGLSSMGFKDKQNMLLQEHVNIAALQKDMKENLEYYQEIADCGRQLILSRHQFCHRAVSLKDTIEAICQNQYRGACWSQGEYHIL